MKFAYVTAIPFVRKADLSRLTEDVERQLSDLSSLITNVFLTSNAMYKDNHLDLYIIVPDAEGNNESAQRDDLGRIMLHLQLDGAYLRYLAPDFRNCISLLLKPIAQLYSSGHESGSSSRWRRSSPGISYRLETTDDVQLPTNVIHVIFSDQCSNAPVCDAICGKIEVSKQARLVSNGDTQLEQRDIHVETPCFFVLPNPRFIRCDAVFAQMDMPASMHDACFSAPVLGAEDAIHFPDQMRPSQAVLWLQHCLRESQSHQPMDRATSKS